MGSSLIRSLLSRWKRGRRRGHAADMLMGLNPELLATGHPHR